MSLSNVTFSGTLKEDPKKRFTPTNIPVTNLMLEVCYVPRGSLNGQEKLLSQVVRVNAWRDLAEECEQKLKAGDKVLVIGRVQVNAYTTNEGKKKREVEIDASSVVSLNEVISLQPPPSIISQPAASFKKTTDELNPEEAVGSVEEIPF